MDRIFSSVDTEKRDVITAIYELRTDVLEEMAKLQAFQCGMTVEVTGIKDHLARLNGSVARHEVSIREHDLAMAKDAGSAETSTRWMDRLHPLIVFLAGAIGMMLLSHADDVLALVKS